jgi:hypothetical protein
MLARSLVVATCLLAGCSGSSSSGGPTGSAGAAGSASTTGACADDMRAEAYSAGMEGTGGKGLYRARLQAIDPAPAIKGTNAWTVQIVDASGTAVEATVTVKPFMPDHGHGSSIVPVVTAKGGGVYEIDSLVLFMPGLWQTTVTITGPAGADTAVFTFCVNG